MNSIPKAITFYTICFITLLILITAVPVLAAANRGLSVPASQLPNELKRANIKDYYAGSGTKQVGAIQTVVGHVVVARQGFRNAYYAASGDRLFEKDIIFTLKGSKCRFKLIGEDVVMMGENTHLGIKDYQTNQQKRAKSSVMTVAKGKAMFYALRLFKHRSNAMVVETPTAVSGVRGTKWGIEVVEVSRGKETASRPIELADTSDTGLRILAQANPPSPPQFQTTILCFSGTVFTGSTAPSPPGAPPPPVVTLLQGQMTTVGSGGSPAPPSLTPPGRANSFIMGTFVSLLGSGSAEVIAAPVASNLGGLPPPPPPLPPDISDLVQKQTQQQTFTDPVQNPGTNYSGTDSGYIALMLTNQSNLTLQEIFASYTRQNGSENVWALGHKNTATDYVRAWGEGGSGSTPYLKYAVINSGASSTGDLSSNYPITDVELEKLTYLSLSYFTMPLNLTIGGSIYSQDNRGYAVFGYNTPSITGLSGSGTYCGNAYGTYWTSAGGINMTGSFSADVDFAYAKITSFTLGVGSDTPNRSAQITNATGSIGSDGHFNIYGGTWILNGNILTSTDYKTAYGSFYGPGAEYMGGNWAMLNKATNEGAVGIYGGPDDMQTRPGSHYGYTSVLISKDSSLYTALLSPSPNDFNSGSIYAQDSSDSTINLNADGTSSYQNFTISSMKTSAGLIDKDNGSGLPATVTSTELGYNPYMEWGYWTQTQTMTTSGYNFSFVNKGYYVHGDLTTDPQMTALAQQGLVAKYSGNAYGTYWSGGTVADLTGSFETNVDFALKTLSGFKIDLSGGGGKTVTLSGASGAFSGSTSQFTITGGTLSATGQSAPGALSHVTTGSVYGISAQAIGGVGAIKDSAGSNGANAVYMYQGRRPL